MSLRRVVIVVLILSALAILIFSIRFNGKLRDALCSEIVIEIRNEKPYSFVSKRAVKEAIEKAGLQVVGQRIEDIKLDKIRSVIEKNPYILSARCYVSKANKLYIDIEERQPMFRVVNFENYFACRKRCCYKDFRTERAIRFRGIHTSRRVSVEAYTADICLAESEYRAYYCSWKPGDKGRAYRQRQWFRSSLEAAEKLLSIENTQPHRLGQIHCYRPAIRQADSMQEIKKTKYYVVQ